VDTAPNGSPGIACSQGAAGVELLVCREELAQADS
jgi:hypothetical protein